MKIGISGTQGVGKSFLLFQLADQYKLDYPDKEVTVVTETARKCPMEINEFASVEAQQWMFANQIQREIEAENNCDIVICDRTLADYMAYIKYQYENLFYKLLPFLDYHISSYDRIIYKELKPEENYLIDDGKRSINRDFQERIDIILRGIYEDLINVKKFETV